MQTVRPSPLAADRPTRRVLRYGVLGVAVFNLVVMVLVAAFLHERKNQYHEQARGHGSSLARILERTLTGNFQKIDMALLAGSDEFQRLSGGRGASAVNRDAMNAFLARFTKRLPEVTALRIADSQGRVLFGVEGNPMPPPEAGDRDYFIHLRDHPAAQLFISKPAWGRITQKWMIFLARRLTDADGRFAGVVFASVDLKNFLQLLASVDVGAHGSVTLRDVDFSILARVPEPGGVGSTVGERRMPPRVRAAVLAGQTAGTVMDNSAIDGKERMFAFHRAPELGLLVLVGLSDDDTLASWRREITYGATVAMVILALTSLAMWLIYRAWLRQRLAMEDARQAQSYNRSLIEATLDPMLAVGVDGRITDVNSATEVLTGLGRQALLGRACSSLFSSPVRAQQAFDVALREGRGKGFDLELCHANGGVTPVLFNASVYRDESGAIVGVVAAARDIAGRKRVEEALRQANVTLEKRVRDRTVKLEQAMADLESFSYTTSHDLRAPLRAINGYAHILLENHKAGLPADAARMLDRIAHNTVKLGQLIDDVLQYSRAGRQELKQEPVDLAELVKQLVAEVGATYPAATVKVADLPVVPGDPTMLRQIFQNLIENAYKFSSQQEQPEIRVSLAEKAGERIFTVADNGVGFDQAYAKRMFGMFQRMHPESQFPGTGVGLAIVKRLVERHGGRIWAEAEVGKGAAFHVVLGDGGEPLKPESSEPEAKAAG